MTDVDVDAALRYAFRGDGTLRRFAIGGGVPSLLNVAYLVPALAALVVPELALLYLPLVAVQLGVGVVLTGYVLRVAERTLDGESEPPAFRDWGELVGDGLRGFGVVLAYQVPLVVASAVAFGLMFLAFAGASSVGESAGAGLGVLGVLVMLVAMLVTMAYSLVMGYLLPISLVSYAASGELSAAFDVETVKPVALSEEYAIPWLIVAGVYMAVASVMSVLTSLLVGYLLVPLLPLVYFYVGVTAMFMFAQAFANVHGREVSDAAEPPAEGAAARRLEDL
jgi:hypothetical protein